MPSIDSSIDSFFVYLVCIKDSSFIRENFKKGLSFYVTFILNLRIILYTNKETNINQKTKSYEN